MDSDQKPRVKFGYKERQLRIDRNSCSVHEEITSIRLRKGVYNLIEVISRSNEPNK
jgi:hypothetical protein